MEAVAAYSETLVRRATSEWRKPGSVSISDPSSVTKAEKGSKEQAETTCVITLVASACS